jgi:Tol biopolymer transport system component
MAIAWLIAWVPVADAAFPGENGKIAFEASSQVHTINPDGTGETNLTPSSDWDPAWSPNGTEIALISPDVLVVMDADGSGRETHGPGYGCDAFDYDPAWSPDATKVLVDVFVEECTEEPPYYYWDANVLDLTTGFRTSFPSVTGNDASELAWSPNGSRIAGNGIETMNPNGSGRTTITTGPNDRHPNWSPDGSKIVFQRGSTSATEIYVVNADGSGLTPLTNNSFADLAPAWSPDGTKIVFSSEADGDAEIFVMDADGGNPTQLTHNTTYDGNPDWQPIIRGYPRPKGATPMRVPLVPALEPCTSPDSTHGAPLSYGSCASPVPESGNAFVGIGDGDPALAKSIGSVRLRTLTGVSFDGADVGIDLAITNVMNTSDRSDYTGELRLELPLRITDRFNKPAPSGYGPGTVSDMSFFATVPCSPTTDATLGSSCTLSTTADTLLPATVRGGARAIWALGQIRLQDGGPDGDAETPADNELFAVQGVFAP